MSRTKFSASSLPLGIQYIGCAMVDSYKANEMDFSWCQIKREMNMRKLLIVLLVFSYQMAFASKYVICTDPQPKSVYLCCKKRSEGKSRGYYIGWVKNRNCKSLGSGWSGSDRCRSSSRVFKPLNYKGFRNVCKAWSDHKCPNKQFCNYNKIKQSL